MNGIWLEVGALSSLLPLPLVLLEEITKGFFHDLIQPTLLTDRKHLGLDHQGPIDSDSHLLLCRGLIVFHEGRTLMKWSHDVNLYLLTPIVGPQYHGTI